jgi:hypothetical protein
VTQVVLIQVSSSGQKASPIILASENISSGGLCVIAPLELPVGGRGAILMQKSDGECVLLGARVVYVNPLDAEAFECGLEFEIQPSAISLNDFSDAAGNLPQIGPSQAA